MSGPRPPRGRRRAKTPASTPARARPSDRDEGGPVPMPRASRVSPARAEGEGPSPAAPRVIRIRGARTHNLAGVDLDLPRDRLVVVTGPSGSGKSSLAFDTIFAEGQRRYVESLSVAARQFLSQLPKPDVDLIDGLSPCVALEQGRAGRNPRSTVGTVTEVHDFLRLLVARVGVAHDPATGRPLARQTREEMVDAVLALPERTRLSVLAPVVQGQAGDHAELLDDLRRKGFGRVAIDDQVRDLAEEVTLDPKARHTVEVYVDRLVLKEGVRARLADSIDLAAELSGGVVRILPVDGEELVFSERFANPETGWSLPEITPALLSFNTPAGACPTCDGLGVRRVFAPDRVVPDPSLSLRDGAILPGARFLARRFKQPLAALVHHLKIPERVPWRDLEPDHRVAIMQGTGTEVVPGLGGPFSGVVPILEARWRELEGRGADEEEDDGAGGSREELQGVLQEQVCPACQGTRLRPEALAVFVEGKNIHDLVSMPADALAAWLRGLDPDRIGREVSEIVCAPALRRVEFLCEVGLSYLHMNRPAMTLSGGELQRIRLATQVGASLVGVTYVLDEPSVGLHPRDTARLLRVLARLRDLGNTVIVVEHDPDTIHAADHVVDMGPGAGRMGGHVVAQGTVAELCAHADSPTGAYLSGRRALPMPERRRSPAGAALTVHKARGHNLRGVTVRFPLGTLICVTGVSGSGKSSLVVDTLLRAASRALHRGGREPLPHERLSGLEHLDKVISVDQRPIGRSPRSNPATFTGILTDLRNLYAQLPEARVRGFSASRFSFNAKGGRCERCKGEGVQRIEMNFLPDVYVTCPACEGRRYNRQTLEIHFRGKSIADVLAMTVDEAHGLFAAQPAIRAKLELLREVGLGYLTLGQRATTLSGGEAQRLKLAKELARRGTGRTLYILDEPTSGLHFSDVAQLLAILQRLVDEGNTVVVIEHDMAVARCADHIIDIGPEGGAEGGRVVAEGTPEQVARVEGSHTAAHLRPWLGPG